MILVTLVFPSLTENPAELTEAEKKAKKKAKKAASKAEEKKGTSICMADFSAFSHRNSSTAATKFK